MRDSFILYTSYQEQMALLTMEQRGVLLTAIMAYSSDADLPDMDGITAMAFSFIRSDLDRDREKYEKTCEARREAGKLGGRPKANGSDEKAKKANGFFEKQTEAKKPDNEYEYDYEDVLKENTHNGVQKKNFQPPTVEMVENYATSKGYHIDAQRFCDFYASKGWMVGKNKMKDWQAAVRNWSRAPDKKSDRKASGRFDNFESRTYNFDELELQLLKAQGAI